MHTETSTLTAVTARPTTLADKLREAIRNGDVRCHVDLVPCALPWDWAVPIASDEVVLATLPVPDDALDAMPTHWRGVWRGVTAIVIKRRALPVAQLDDEIRERIAVALVDMLFGGEVTP